MKSVGELIIRVANLAEAEGRAAKHHAVRILSSTVLFLCAGLLLVAGIIAFCAALFMGLGQVMPAAVALGLISLIPIGLGTAGVLYGVHLIREEGSQQ